MTNLINYIGLANIFFFGIAITLLVRKSDKIKLARHTISCLANDKKTASFFNTSLFVFAVGQVIFSFRVNEKISSNPNSLALPLFLLGGVALCFASIFPTGKHTVLHTLSAALSATLVGIGVTLMSLNLLSLSTILGSITIGATFLVPASYLLRHKLTGAYWELILFGGVAIWNFTFSIPLIFW